MGGKAARTKGASGEREVIALISQYLGLECHRTPGSGNLSWMKGDVYGVPNLHIECKRQEKLSIPAWIAQAKEQAEGKPWVVAFRRSREEWNAVMPLQFFLQILKRGME